VIILTDPNPEMTTGGITSFVTHGDEMVGMTVTAVFANNTSETAVWTATGTDAGSATGSSGGGWSLAHAGDTFGTAWTLQNAVQLELLQLTLDGQPGRTLFDRTEPSPGTPNSAAGWDFQEVSAPASLTMTATYQEVLAIGTNSPLEDEWVRLSVRFSLAGRGLPANARVQFIQDTDNAETDIIGQVPEPTTMTLLGLGVLALVRRRRKS